MQIYNIHLNIKISKKLSNDKYIIVISKPQDCFMLRDILSYYKNKIPIEHTTWILSRLYNYSCFLEYNNIACNGMTLDGIFICPEQHSITLTNFFFTTKLNDEIKALPKDIFNLFTLKNKNSSYTIDLDSIKYLGRFLLGDKSGITLKKSVNENMVNWLNSSSNKSPLETFKEWDNVIIKIFGKKHWVDMKIKKTDIYK